MLGFTKEKSVFSDEESERLQMGRRDVCAKGAVLSSVLGKFR